MRLLLLIGLVMLGGCQFVPPRPNAPAQVVEEDWGPTLANTSPGQGLDGSLYVPGQILPLYQDGRAYRVGDILTIVLDEDTQSVRGSDSSFNKSTQVNADAPTVAGKSIKALSATANSTGKFAGNAAAKQNNSINGYITVTVGKVMSNGVLFVHGQKLLNLGQGTEAVRFRGFVRGADISQSNQVSSQKVANAQIIYAHEAAKSAPVQETGWLSRFFQNPLSPF